ncbi:MAG: hypothetical protein ABIJ74_01165 [archaeon]
MERNNLIAIILVLLIFVSAGAYFFYPAKEFKYSEEINGIMFYSNSFSSPQKYFSETVRERDSFMIVSELDSKKENIAIVSSQIALASGILSATGKFVSSVVIVLDEKNQVDYCQTNFGSKSTNEQLTKRQCDNLIENSSEFKFIIKAPDASLSKPVVELYNNSVVIMPVKSDESIVVLQMLFTAMYNDSKEIIDRINNILSSVTG